MKLWPTPTASDYRGAQTIAACKQWSSRGQNLAEAVVVTESAERELKCRSNLDEGPAAGFHCPGPSNKTPS